MRNWLVAEKTIGTFDEEAGCVQDYEDFGEQSLYIGLASLLRN
jgi:hypothetical protein